MNPDDPDAATPGVLVSSSRVELQQLMLPADANPLGSIHGGAVLKLIDSAAAVVGWRHARGPVVTARLDDISFLRPVSVGNLLVVKASANAAWRTSIEVGVRVEAEDLSTGGRWHVASAYVIMVAVDAQGKPRPVPPVKVETQEDERRFTAAQQRRVARAS
ncbi:MAG: acyl-CoA thioesterase [Chloroflexi bacterium]|nr:acyl-CoA thioesterase [Chloroflexota bacterium]